MADNYAPEHDEHDRPADTQSRGDQDQRQDTPKNTPQQGQRQGGGDDSRKQEDADRKQEQRRRRARPFVRIGMIVVLLALIIGGVWYWQFFFNF